MYISRWQYFKEVFIEVWHDTIERTMDDVVYWTWPDDMQRKPRKNKES